VVGVLIRDSPVAYVWASHKVHQSFSERGRKPVWGLRFALCWILDQHCNGSQSVIGRIFQFLKKDHLARLPEKFVCKDIQINPLLERSVPENTNIRLIPNIPY
jgi:hypothetical protein